MARLLFVLACALASAAAFLSPTIAPFQAAAPLARSRGATVMMAKKGPREIITLESTASTGHRYTTMKNKKNTPDRLRIKKYDPVIRKHVEYVEIKK